jgi:hypothetical protein
VPLAEPSPDVPIAGLQPAELRTELMPAADLSPDVPRAEPPLAELLPAELRTEPLPDDPPDGTSPVSEQYMLARQHYSWDTGRSYELLPAACRINRVMMLVCTNKVSDELEVKLILI